MAKNKKPTTTEAAAEPAAVDQAAVAAAAAKAKAVDDSARFIAAAKLAGIPKEFSVATAEGEHIHAAMKAQAQSFAQVEACAVRYFGTVDDGMWTVQIRTV